MTIDLLRRQMLAGLAAVPTLGSVAFAAGEAKPEDKDANAEAAAAEKKTYVTGDVVLGADDAPVTVIEYASLTCPHCASFHNNTWPEIKKQYVDTGKVRFIMREVYFDRYGLWAAMVARCGGEAGYYPMIDTYLKNQRQWARAEDIGLEIQKIGRRAGLPAKMLEACMTDQDFAKALVTSYQENAERDKVRSTPTFIINGDLHSGDMSVADFSALLDDALKGS